MNYLALNMQRFIQSGVMAIIRIDSCKDVLPTVEALAKGGIEFIEISLVTPHAVEYIAKVHEQFGSSVMIGAGTVLDGESARAAILAGADFIVSPATRVETILTARRYGKTSFSGAFSPTECLLAWESGADAVKVFPAMPAGPEYIKAIHAPLPQIPLVAVGGVTLENLPAFFKAGVCGVAGASSLANPKLIADGSFKEITQVSASWLEAVRRSRGS
jgi:2-dehydro-3-deoxyphosphogluconate aldolase / (4S)-4-hydroxy-2-oxoglutarate aldolase